MNPVVINTTNVVKFGFSATFDFLNRYLILTIDGKTEFNPGGEANVAGVTFELIDPSGVTVAAIDWNVVMIDPDNWLTTNFQLPAGDGIFGTWKIKGALKEADGQVYYATIPDKEICKPTGMFDDVVAGTVELKADCNVPFIRVSEKTALSYKGLSPLTTVKTGVLYWPRGTVADLAFTSTPFQDNRLYTGEYVSRLRTISTYDMGDDVYVKVSYDSVQKLDVTCQDSICDIACCLEELYAKYQANCNNAKGADAKEKLEKIAVPLMLAQAKEKCGKDAKEEIAIIRDILDCHCDCSGKKVEGTPIQLGGGNAVVIAGQCAATVGAPIVAGSTTTYPIKVKSVSVAKGDVGDLAYSITTEETECEIKYKLTWDYNVLANTILHAIDDDEDLQDYLNTLIYNIGAGPVLSGLDGKCVIDLTECDYLFTESRLSTNKVSYIRINSTDYNAPANLLITDAAGILAWLNGLGKGVFTVGSVVNGATTTITIQSNSNINKVNTIAFIQDDVEESKNFVATCTTLVEILQAIIDYLCALTTAQIKLGIEIEMCKLSDDGTEKEIVTVDPTVLLSVYLAEINANFCDLIDKVLSIANVTCARMKELHPFRQDIPMAAADGLYAVKNGECSRVSPKELALFIYALTQTDVDLKAAFCAIDCGKVAGNCPNITDFVNIAAGADEISITSVTYSYAQTFNQFLTIKYRQYGSPTWIVATTTAEAYTNGNLVTPYVISDLLEGVAYEVDVQVTPTASCNPTGVTKIITMAVIAANTMSFVNSMDADAFQISSIKFDAGANLLGAPLLPGESFTYDYTALGAGPFAIKMTFTGLANPTKLFTAQMRGVSQIIGTYFDYTTGEATIHAIMTPVSGDVIYVRNAAEHLKLANYSANEGSIAPSCSLPAFTISRTAIATADATANAASVDVTVDWTASNGGTSNDTVTFAAADNSKGGAHADIGVGVCTYVDGVISNVV